MHKALSLCELPVLGIPWATERSTAASTVRSSRCWGDCTGCCSRAGQVVCAGCGFAAFWSVPVEEVLLGNQSAQHPVRVCVTSSGHAMSHCKVTGCCGSADQVVYGVAVLPLSGGVFQKRRRSSASIQCTEPCQYVCDQSLACVGTLQGQMQLMLQ